MTPPFEKEKLVRLEDFIILAKEGRKVEADVELKKVQIVQKVHPEETEEMRDEVDAYLLSGEYTFQTEGERFKVSKIYIMGSSLESLDMARVNKSIANDRLKMDYKRLGDAGILFEPKYF
ncbi:MAG: hypothetical protein FJ243_00955 [Nitrospira sp.]|nr:hypothetical protein [Nitrospira sp.]